MNQRYIPAMYSEVPNSLVWWYSHRTSYGNDSFKETIPFLLTYTEWEVPKPLSHSRFDVNGYFLEKVGPHQNLSATIFCRAWNWRVPNAYFHHAYVVPTSHWLIFVAIKALPFHPARALFSTRRNDHESDSQLIAFRSDWAPASHLPSWVAATPHI